MIRYYDLAGVVSIPEEELEIVENQSFEGDPTACFKMAMVYLHRHPCDDYIEQAHELLKTASAGGVADADAAIGMMMFKGQIEPYDPLQAAKVIEKAILNKSVLAVAFQLRNILYGRYGYKQNTEKAAEMVDQLMETMPNPYWYGLKGEVLAYQNKNIESEEWFEQAVNAGLVSYYSDLAIARGLDDECIFRDYDAFSQTALEGGEAGDAMCFYHYVLTRIPEYDDIEDPDTREEYRSLIIAGLEEKAELSHAMSMELLGDIYKDGMMDIPVDHSKAWSYYVQGSEYYRDSCFEKMYDMLEADQITLGSMSKDEAMDLCMINGARLHNRNLLIATVGAYRHGRLTQFAREIELYHIPAYEALPDEDPFDFEDEDLDDDGRFDAWA